jgi:HK97 family phage portal protein
MGLIERVAARKREADRRKGNRAWPVGVGAVPLGSASMGHDQSQFSPEEYADYSVTSNEIFAAVSLRARLMSSLRLRFYRGDDEAKKAMPTHPAARLLRYVNPFWTEVRLARMDELAMGLHGQTFWALEPGSDGKPAEIWWLKPSRVKPVPDEHNYLKGYLYEPAHGGKAIPFAPHEVVWHRYPNPIDEFSPLSPLAAARLAADAAAAMMKSNEKLFRQGLQIAGTISPADNKVTFSQEQASDLADMLERRFAGADKAHKWAVLRYEAKFNQMAMSPRDAEFATGLNLTLRQVANAYGIPVPLLNDTSSATLANVDGFTKILWAHSLVPDADLRAAEVREQYLPLWGRQAPDHCEYDYSQVPALQESRTETWMRDAQALDRGAITINEWRARNGMPAVKWGDRPWLPVNKATVQDDGKSLLLPEGSELLPDDLRLPDDETNPAAQPAQSKGETVEPPEEGRLVDHHAARRLISEAFGDGGRVNGHALR